MTNSQWYKEAVFYELRIGAFYDSDGDGVGDFKGLTQKLDYLQDLGITTIWLLPFYPSPFRDDGYDISNYTAIHPQAGTLADFKVFLREAHRRGIYVVTELVLNHTSDQHPWFKRARASKSGSRWRDFYVWSETPERYKGTRVIFKDYEPSNWTWDAVAQAYYWHRFYSHQPDLNFDNPLVRRAVMRALEFWLNLGVDGLRLDAVPYLYEREGTSCENLPESHAFLKELRRFVDSKYENRMILAEANQWPEDAAAYFGEGDECHMAFHFPIMPRLFMAIHMEDRYPIVDILRQTPPVPESSQWALFLRNHDELTLEMVTDEERDYMYRVYAQDPQARINLGIRRRLAPLLGNNRRKIELMNGLLLSLPGTPVIYYGDEIGMGDNFHLGDRNGVRTPMQWSSDRNAGFSKANPHRLYLPVILDPEYHYETVNVEAQQANHSSILWWMKRLIALRRRYKAFGSGSIEFLSPRNPRVLAFTRRYEDQNILVVANLSRFVQYVELDLSAFKGKVPVELFGQTRFPAVGELPYLLTLGPHAFYWFSLETVSGPVSVSSPAALPFRTAAPAWPPDRKESRVNLEKALISYIRSSRWFGGKARRIKSVVLSDTMPLPFEGREAFLCLAEVEYAEGQPDLYQIPLACAYGEKAASIEKDASASVVALWEESGEKKGMVYEPLGEPAFWRAFLETILRRRMLKGHAGKAASAYYFSHREAKGLPQNLEPKVLGGEQSNTCVVFGERFILKLYRRLGEGPSPDLEILRFLDQNTVFENSPGLAGQLEYFKGKTAAHTLASLQDFVPNEGDAWRLTLDHLGRYLEQGMAQPPVGEPEAKKPVKILDLACQEIPSSIREREEAYLGHVEQLGRRTAELHLALNSNQEIPEFSPEPFTPFYQRSLYQSMRNLTASSFHLLRDQLDQVPVSCREAAEKVLSSEGRILKFFKTAIEGRVTALRSRHHGDFHLGQALFTGKDFILFDFEGEPARPYGERKIKRSPLRDAAGIIRSFHYAAHTAVNRQLARGISSPDMVKLLRAQAHEWYRWSAAAYIKAYLERASGAAFLPKSNDELKVLLDVYLLEKAVYEINYELNNRPDWLEVPLAGILELMETLP